MTSTDKKLYQIFARKELSEACLMQVLVSDTERIYTYYDDYEDGIEWFKKHFRIEKIIEILWHEPQLHDVFRLAKDRWYSITISDWFGWVIWIINGLRNNNIPYNPTLSLLSQTEETKLSLIQLFS